MHVISGIGWLGRAMPFGLVLSPLFPSLSTGGRGELIVKLYPKFIRYIVMVALSTLIFGAALAAAMVLGAPPDPAPSGLWMSFIGAGAGIALVATALALGVLIPAMRKTVKLILQMQASPGSPPSPELSKLQSRMKTAALTRLVLLFVVVVCMVGATWAP